MKSSQTPQIAKVNRSFWVACLSQTTFEKDLYTE